MKIKKTYDGPGQSPHLPPTVTTVKRGTKRAGIGEDVHARWWMEPDEDVYRHVQAVLSTIDNRQATRRFANARWLKMYSNFDSTGLVGGAGGRLMPSAMGYVSNAYRFTLNVVESCIDAAASKISKSTPLPKFITSKGKFKQQKKSKLLNKYVEGMINQLNVYEKSQQVFVDSCIWGTGALKLFIEDGQVKAKRVMIDDIIVDEQDGRDGDPRQLHQRGHMNRDILLELYPEHRDQILNAAAAFPSDKFTPVSQELVAITESWHLPSIEGADDGLHVVCTDNCTLYAEKWDRDWFPFAFLRWKPRPLGFYGMGLAEQLGPLQVEINKICILIQESIQRMAKPNVFVPNNSNIVASQISEKIGAIIRTNGPIPTVMVPQAQSPEVYEWLENLYKKAYEITGISQANAQSQKPSGINSGAAMREYQDIETARFELTAQRYENFFCDVAKMLITLSRELYTTDKGLSMKVAGKKFLETIDWKDADIAEDEFAIEIFPESSLPSTPRGRLQTISELTQAGYISKERSLELLDFPDLEEFVSVQLAALEDARMTVDDIRWEGKYTTPTPLMNLQTCIDLAHSAWLNSQQMDTPQKNLDMLVDFMNECQSLVDASQPPPMPMAPPLQPGMPPPPGAPPLQGRADGGPVAPGQDVVVGERGPEIVHFNQPGTVVPHEASNIRNMPMVQQPHAKQHAPSHDAGEESLGQWARRKLGGHYMRDGSWMSDDEFAARQYIAEHGAAWRAEHPDVITPQQVVKNIRGAVEDKYNSVTNNPAGKLADERLLHFGTAQEEADLGRRMVPQPIQDFISRHVADARAAEDARHPQQAAPNQPVASAGVTNDVSSHPPGFWSGGPMPVVEQPVQPTVPQQIQDVVPGASPEVAQRAADYLRERNPWAGLHTQGEGTVTRPTLPSLASAMVVKRVPVEDTGAAADALAAAAKK